MAIIAGKPPSYMSIMLMFLALASFQTILIFPGRMPSSSLSGATALNFDPSTYLSTVKSWILPYVETLMSSNKNFTQYSLRKC